VEGVNVKLVIDTELFNVTSIPLLDATFKTVALIVVFCVGDVKGVVFGSTK
jgi:hypothetical protein